MNSDSTVPTLRQRSNKKMMKDWRRRNIADTGRDGDRPGARWPMRPGVPAQPAGKAERRDYPESYSPRTFISTRFGRLPSNSP
jgi:hypothetical protein